MDEEKKKLELKFDYSEIIKSAPEGVRDELASRIANSIKFAGLSMGFKVVGQAGNMITLSKAYSSGDWEKVGEASCVVLYGIIFGEIGGMIGGLFGPWAAGIGAVGLGAYGGLHGQKVWASIQLNDDSSPDKPPQPGPDEEDKWKWLLGLLPLRRDPIALDLDGDGVEFVKGGAYFDFDNNKFAERATWIGKDDGWLALDKNGDGKIGDGSELFGEAMRKKDGTLAKDGFDALVEFDDNKDGKIDSSDAIYSQLRVWQDANGNGITETTARRLPTKAVLSGKMVPAGR